MTCIKEKTALRGTHNVTAQRLVPRSLEVNIKKARLQGPGFHTSRIMPLDGELKASGESSSRAEIGNGGTFQRQLAGKPQYYLIKKNIHRLVELFCWKTRCLTTISCVELNAGQTKQLDLWVQSVKNIR